MRYALGFVALIAGGLCIVSPAAGDEPTEREFLDKLERQVRRAALAAEPSIACIVVSRSEQYPKTSADGETPGKLGDFDRAEFLKTNASVERLRLADRLDLSNPQGVASHVYVGGVVIDAAGLVLTTYHAIEGASKLYVHLPQKNGTSTGSYADIHAADARSDLAVLKLIHPPEGLKPIAFADVRTTGPKPTVYPGKLVGLMANPCVSGFALGSPAFYYGGIDSVRYRFPRVDLTPPKDSYYRYGQFLEYHVNSKDTSSLHPKPFDRADDRPNESTTGGVLVNLDGEMIGLTTASAVVSNRVVGPGYAMPMDVNMRRLVDVLRRGEEVEYGFLGIEVSKDAQIIEVSQVTRYSPADYARLTGGDIITAIDDVKAENYLDLLLYASNALAGTKVKLTVKPRNERSPRTVTVTLGKFKNDQTYIASVRPVPVFGLRVDYLSVLLQQAQLRLPGAGVRTPDVRGVCVRELIPNSPAAARFKTLGDNPIITHVNGTPVATPAEFYAAAKGRTEVKLIVRDAADTRREVTLP